MSIISYGGIIFFHGAEISKRVQSIPNISAILSDCNDAFCEIAYCGRDANRFTVNILKELARTVVNTETEICCTLEDDNGLVSFEYYTISGGKLYCEKAWIVRGDRLPVN